MNTHGIYPFPDKYDGRRIRRRIPYVLAGDLSIPANITAERAFADGTFYHGVELPFEVCRAKPSVVTLDTNGANQADPNIGSVLHMVQLRIKLIGSSRDMTAVATRLHPLLQGDDLTWSFDTPIVLKQRDGFSVYGINSVPSANAAGGVRIELAFLGSLLDLE